MEGGSITNVPNNMNRRRDLPAVWTNNFGSSDTLDVTIREEVPPWDGTDLRSGWRRLRVALAGRKLVTQIPPVRRPADRHNTVCDRW
jgi:hypothetical protein